MPRSVTAAECRWGPPEGQVSPNPPENILRGAGRAKYTCALRAARSTQDAFGGGFGKPGPRVLSLGSSAEVTLPDTLNSRKGLGNNTALPSALMRTAEYLIIT